MNPFLLSLILVGTIACALVVVACCLFRWGNGYWPAWFYGIAFAGRAGKDSALTIAAALLDADDDCKDWVTNGRIFDRDYTHSETGMVISIDYHGDLRGVRVGGKSAEIDSWGWYCLTNSFGDWVERRDAIRARAVNQEAAEAVQRAYGGAA